MLSQREEQVEATGALCVYESALILTLMCVTDHTHIGLFVSSFTTGWTWGHVAAAALPPSQ